MICHALGAFSVVLAVSRSVHSYSVFVFNDLSLGYPPGRSRAY
jgi:hypothetical protein